MKTMKYLQLKRLFLKLLYFSCRRLIGKKIFVSESKLPRIYINGKLSAFQAEDMSSILITRIVLFSKIYTGRLMRERKILFMHS